MPYPLASTVDTRLAPDGTVVGALPALSDARLVELYRWMLLGRHFSERMVALQRQGRIGTFASLRGQEAANVGIAAPLQPGDWLVGSYREALAYFVRGVPLSAVLKAYKGYIADTYTREAGCLPFQIFLAAQMLHGVGIAMAMRYERSNSVAVAVLGDGAASEGEFSEALNMAAVFRAPVVFVVQNNGWAISTPRRHQSAAEFIAHHGPAFGMPGYVIDGNDLLAVHEAMAEAAARARRGEGPSLLELITYRLDPHTTADDAGKYRSEEEVQPWLEKDPLHRFSLFLRSRNLLDDASEEALQEGVHNMMQTAVEELEALPPEDPARLFALTFAQPTPALQVQLAAWRPLLPGAPHKE